VELAERGKHVVVALDQAHLRSPEQLEAVCLLMNAELDSVEPFGLGASAALDQRIAFRFHIQGITATETNAYASHHLGLAGRPNRLFSDDVIALVHQVSRRLARTLPGSSRSDTDSLRSSDDTVSTRGDDSTIGHGCRECQDSAHRAHWLAGAGIGIRRALVAGVPRRPSDACSHVRLLPSVAADAGSRSEGGMSR